MVLSPNGPGRVHKASHSMRCNARCYCSGLVPAALAALFLAGPFQDHLPEAHGGEGSLWSRVLRMHHWLSEWSHATPHERHLLDGVSQGCLGRVNALDVLVHWGHPTRRGRQRRSVPRTACSKNPSPQMAEPAYGSTYPKDHTLAVLLDCLLQPLSCYGQHPSALPPGLLGPERQDRETLKQGALTGGFPGTESSLYSL